MLILLEATMEGKPMHDIKFNHAWQKVGMVEPDSERLGERVEECAQCGAHQRVFFFPRGGTLPTPRDHSLNLDKMAEGARRHREWYGKELRSLLDSGGYASQDALLLEIDNRYERKVDGNSLTLEQLQTWSAIPTRRLQRKAILLYRQGFVCNRCDSIIHSWNDFEVDHIFPRKYGGGSQLTNLQLLCSPCHKVKGDSLPDERDISPFRNTGEACVHVISCTDLTRL